MRWRAVSRCLSPEGAGRAGGADDGGPDKPEADPPASTPASGTPETPAGTSPADAPAPDTPEAEAAASEPEIDESIDRTTTVVFLHIPKTAGQTIHAELTRVMGAEAASPIRVHSQAKTPEAQMPPGYRLYSGHIDWLALDTLPEKRFVFTVLRDPLERIASFYFFLRREAERAGPEALEDRRRVGMRRILSESADGYFFGGKPQWQRFIYDHYHSPYCSYLVTRRMRGFSEVASLRPSELAARAEAVARGLDGVYSVDNLGDLERDLKDRLGFVVDLQGRVVNAAPQDRSERRWPALEAQLSPSSVTKLRRFAWADQLLMARLGLGEDPGPRP